MNLKKGEKRKLYFFERKYQPTYLLIVRMSCLFTQLKGDALELKNIPQLSLTEAIVLLFSQCVDSVTEKSSFN